MPSKKNPKQLTANVGLFYAANQLAKRGWNVLPTSRNARGPDLLIYSQNGKKTHKIQVKSMTNWEHIKPGPKENFLMSDFVIICTNVYDEIPNLYIAKTSEIYTTVNVHGFINKKKYLKYRDNWKIIKGSRRKNEKMV